MARPIGKPTVKHRIYKKDNDDFIKIVESKIRKGNVENLNINSSFKDKFAFLMNAYKNYENNSTPLKYYNNLEKLELKLSAKDVEIEYYKDMYEESKNLIQKYEDVDDKIVKMRRVFFNDEL